MTVLLWLRDDLRLVDHEALTAACHDALQAGCGVVAVWVREERSAGSDGTVVGPRPLGAATRWWYHRSLERLRESLATLGVALVHARGDARELLPRIATALGATSVRWSRRYAPASVALDTQVKQALQQQGTEAHSHAGSLLVEPWTVATRTGSHYTVFTPFHRAAAELDVPPPLPVPEAPPALAAETRARLDALHREGLLCPLADLGLLDEHPPWWRDTVARHWEPGEVSAQRRVADIEQWLPRYRSTRNLPADDDATSALSPHLRTGEVSPRTLWHAADTADVPPADRQAWVRQLYWREFCWHLTHHVPDLDTRPLRRQFDGFTLERDEDLAAAWQQGRTGLDLVDAGMRQLWQTGWMHNRVRMVTASLFSKNLLQPWQHGEQWFWDTLVDADEANNPVSWQWVAGCGADAAPYVRVFNPELQREKFDPDGAYCARWLAGADDRPVAPLVDLMESRRAAIDAWRRATGEADAPAAPAARQPTLEEAARG